MPRGRRTGGHAHPQQVRNPGGIKSALGKVNYKKLADKKINTLIERRQVEIARQEVEKNRVILIKRSYWFSTYDTATNLFTVLGNDMDRTDFAGTALELSHIRIRDIDFLNPTPYNLDAGEAGGPTDNRGSGVGYVTLPPHGRRAGAFVLVKGVRLQFRAKVEATADEAPFDDVHVRFAIVAWKSPLTSTADSKVSALRALPWHPWGYSPSMEPIQQQDETNEKIRTLVKGQMQLRYRADMPVIKEWNKTIMFPKPLRIQYEDGDQLGRKPLTNKIFLVVRTSLPTVQVGQDTDHYSTYQPSLSAVTKLFYYEP